MIILICGDRNWIDKEAIKRELRRFDPLSDILIEGEARGADQLSKVAARELGWVEDNILKFPAQWDTYGRSAGPIRNKQMLDENPDLVLAFHTNIAKSKGTGHMVRIARAKGTPVEVFDK